MTDRSLPQLDRTHLPYRPDRPAPEAVFALQDGPPSETVAYEVLVRFVTEEEARRQQKAFAHLLIEPRRLERLGSSDQVPDMISAAEVEEWLEAGWLAEQDMARGLDPRRWSRGALGDVRRQAPPYQR